MIFYDILWFMIPIIFYEREERVRVRVMYHNKDHNISLPLSSPLSLPRILID